LGLAVPIVHVVAAGRLFEKGIMVKDGSATERLADVDTIVFDKTGTLTSGKPRLANTGEIDPGHLQLAAAIAAHSRHPFSRCLAAFSGNSADLGDFVSVDVTPCQGVEAKTNTATDRLGRAEWALSQPQAVTGTVLSRDGILLSRFRFEDELREGAVQTIAELRRCGFHLLLLSGDHPDPVAAIAGRLGVTDFAAAVQPGEKVARIEALAATGGRVLMVGDGLNDAPALSAAHVSMAPAEAADVGRNAADFVFLRPSLSAVLTAMEIATRSGRLIRQNITLAIVYNAIAVPVAALGYVTPLVAALSMSLSSILVVANALRLRTGRADRTFPARPLSAPKMRAAE
jgi:Cu2+-exporting ATPase